MLLDLVWIVLLEQYIDTSFLIHESLIKRSAGHQRETSYGKSDSGLLLVIGQDLYAVLMKSTRKFRYLRQVVS